MSNGNVASFNIHPAVGANLANMNSLIKREMGDVLAGLSALEALVTAARVDADTNCIGDALEFITNNIYTHVNAVIDCQEDFEARFNVINQ